MRNTKFHLHSLVSLVPSLPVAILQSHFCEAWCEFGTPNKARVASNCVSLGVQAKTDSNPRYDWKTFFHQQQLPSLKLTYPLKMMVSNRNLLFQGAPIFRGYIIFREGILFVFPLKARAMPFKRDGFLQEPLKTLILKYGKNLDLLVNDAWKKFQTIVPKCWFNGDLPRQRIKKNILSKSKKPLLTSHFYPDCLFFMA